jgi:hypothetical protein
MSDTLVYELRSYRVADGRMDEELRRALDCILAPADGGRGLFDRYGIPRPIGLWRALSGPHHPSAIFLYGWKSLAERAHSFETFYADPEWQALRASTNDGSEIVDCMDDLLLLGPAPAGLPSDAIYEFVRGEPSKDMRTVIGPLAPLCGNDPTDLSVVIHEATASLVGADGAFNETRTLCRRVTLGDEA